MIPHSPDFAQAVRASFGRQGAVSHLGTRLVRVGMAAHAAGRKKACATALQAIMPVVPFVDRVADRVPA